MDTSKKKNSFVLMWGLFILYSISTFTKINYSASIAYIVKEGIFSKTDSGFISAAFYLVYGVGQLVFAKLIDKYSPYDVELAGLFGSLLCNFALCFSNNYFWVLGIWSVNGVFLSVIWPSAVRLLSEYVLDEHRKKATSILTLSIAFGGIGSYAVVPFILESFGWYGMFALNSFITLIIFIAMIFLKIKTEKILYVKKEPEAVIDKITISDNFFKLLLTSGVGLICVIALVRAVLDNGLKTWIPTMMMESYSISTVWANMQTAVIYICNMLGILVIIPPLLKLKNEVKMLIVVYALCMPLVIALVFIGKIPQLVAIICLVLLTTFTYSMNSVQIMFSSKFASKGVGHSGAVASLLNAFASFGVLIASAVFGYLAENYSWQTVCLFSVVLTALSIMLAVPGMIQWGKFNK